MSTNSPGSYGYWRPTELSGRNEELTALRALAREVLQTGEARAATLIGPNGVGKTRILEVVLDDLGEHRGRRFRIYRGSARASPLGYAAFASLLRARFGLVDGGDSDEARAQIRAQVEKVLDDRKVGDVCFFIGQILELPFPDSPLTKAMSDDVQQGPVLRQAVIRKFFESDAARGPICFVFDDLDAAGDDAVALVAHLVEHLTGPALILGSARPEFLARHPGWFRLGEQRHRRIDVRPVADDIASEIMKDLLGPCEGGAPTELVDAAVRLASGNVGLLQAMVRLFHDCGVLEEVNALAEQPRWRVNVHRLGTVRLPTSVDDTVSMRLAALLPEERRLLEHAAAMGNVFWLGGLLALSRLDHKPPTLWAPDAEAELERLETLLASLEQRDYVRAAAVSRFSNDRQYAFEHSLERDKLAELTDEADARRYHQLIADWLRERETSRPRREQVEALARHLERAGERVQAGLMYLQAADAARASYAAKEADHGYARGLELLGDSDAHRRLDALHNRGDVLTLLGRPEEALSLFRQMLSLAYRLDLRAKGGAAHNRIGRIHRAMGVLPEAMKHLEAALALFESVEDARGVAACHDDVGKLLWLRGEYEEALSRMRIALDMRKEIGDRRSIALSLHNIGGVWRDHGRPVQAEEALDAALKIRQEIGDLLGVSETLDSMGRLAQNKRDLQKAKDLFQQAYEVAKDIGERSHFAVVLTNLGEVRYRLGDTVEAIEILKRAEELCGEVGDQLHVAEAKRGLAKAYLMQGDLKKARVSIKQAVDLFGQVRSKAHLASALRTLGEITAAGAWGPSHESKAVEYFMRSIALCKEIGNEIEIAKSYRCFSDYVAVSEHYRHNANIQAEATKLRSMADEIFARHDISPDPSNVV